MDTNEVALIISAIAASIATVVYSMKHVKKSNCCGSSCVQETNVDLELGKVKSTEV